jgi:hypothetical protein
MTNEKVNEPKPGSVIDSVPVPSRLTVYVQLIVEMGPITELGAMVMVVTYVHPPRPSKAIRPTEVKSLLSTLPLDWTAYAPCKLSLPNPALACTRDTPQVSNTRPANISIRSHKIAVPVPQGACFIICPFLVPHGAVVPWAWTL